MEKNKKIRWIILFILIIVFCLIAILVKTNSIQWFDDYIYNIIKNMQTNGITNILKTFTKLGGIKSLFIITLITVIILFIYNKKKIAIAIASNTIISSFSYIIIKNIIQRPRPEETGRLIEETRI